MKVIEFRAENFKKLKAVEIHPEPTVQVISGANGAGKSSILDAIWAALGGADMSKETGTIQPIREGEEKASVRLDLGDFIVTRKWTKSGSTVTVENKDGAVYKTPQALLDGLIGKISLDPLNFSNADSKYQRDVLLSIVKIPADLVKIDGDRQEKYIYRTALNRDIKAMNARLAAMPAPAPGTPETEVSTEPIIEAQRVAVDAIRQNNQARAIVTRLSDDVDRIDAEIVAAVKETEALYLRMRELNDKLEKMKQESAAKRVALKTEGENVAALVDPDLNSFSVKLREVETTNRAVRAAQDRKKLFQEIGAVETLVAELTAAMTVIEKQKTDAIAAASFPVPGLGFNDTGVTFKGLPFAQCSSAEKLRVSVAVAMSAAPKLRVIRITDGSLIDSKNLEILSTLAKENDFQLWIEKVDESGKVGVYIEDGEVKA